MTKYKVLSCPIQMGQVIYKESETFDSDDDFSDLILSGIVQEMPTQSTRKPKEKPTATEDIFKDSQ